jgi:predicted hotdog family 3-hydroxylacyl-ACP dehydratase
LDRVLWCDESEVSCSAQVTESCPFVRAGERPGTAELADVAVRPGTARLPGIALLEYMAQAIAVFVTLERRRSGDGAVEPRPGYLIGARDVELFVASLAVGERFEVRARLDWNEAQVARFNCRVTHAEHCLAAGWLTVYERDAGAS